MIRAAMPQKGAVVLLKRQSFKAVVSTLLVLCLLFLAFTGALLYFGKTGVVWGFARNNLRAAHFFTAVCICVLAALHILISRRLYLAELRSLRRTKKNGPDKRAGAGTGPGALRSGERVDGENDR